MNHRSFFASLAGLPAAAKAALRRVKCSHPMESWTIRPFGFVCRKCGKEVNVINPKSTCFFKAGQKIGSTITVKSPARFKV